MNKILTLIKQGWVVDEIRYDQWQKWYYVHAVHESQEVSVESNSNESLNQAMNDLYESAISSTPKWYLEQLKTIKWYLEQLKTIKIPE